MSVSIAGEKKKLCAVLEKLDEEGHAPELIGYDNNERPVIAWIDKAAEPNTARVMILRTDTSLQSDVIEIPLDELAYPVIIMSYY